MLHPELFLYEIYFIPLSASSGIFYYPSVLEVFLPPLPFSLSFSLLDWSIFILSAFLRYSLLLPVPFPTLFQQ